MDNKVKEAIDILRKAFKDSEYWYKQKTVKRYLNKTDKHIIANESADYFLKLLEQ